MSDTMDQRPPVAVGHVRLNVNDVGAAARWFETVGLRPIVTWNAAANTHMIAINETLGYELLDPQSRSFEVPVADILGAG